MLSAADTRLADAVKQRDQEGLRSLLTAHADVNGAQGDGTTALHWAAHWDDIESADLLMRAGANLNAATDYGVTPLWLACAHQNGAMVEKLLAAGANPNASIWSGDTVLMNCSGNGNAKGAIALLAHGADVNAKESRHEQTALMWAAAGKHPEVVRALIDHGADIHARSKIMPALERVGQCTVKNPCKGGRTDGDADVATSHWPKTTGGFTALLFAAQQGDVESARMLLDAGVDVDESTAEEGTALLIASASGQENVAMLLLQRGANPNAKDAFGITPLHYALHDGMLKIVSKPGATDGPGGWLRPNMPALVKALLDHGANPNARIERDFPARDYLLIARYIGTEIPQMSLVGATPFLLAAASSDTSLMRALYAKGADPKLGTVDGVTPVMVAAGFAQERDPRKSGTKGGASDREQMIKRDPKPFLAAVQLAVELGGDVNHASNDARTALHAATFLGLADVIQFLVAKGAKLDAADGLGDTPLAIALAVNREGFGRKTSAKSLATVNARRFRNAREPQPEIAQLLIKLGATPELATGDKDTRQFADTKKGEIRTEDQ